MSNFNLPEDCQLYLRNNNNKVIELNIKSAEIEKVIFNSLDELKNDYQIIDTYEYFLNYNEFKKDPEIQYHIPAINLIKRDAEDNYDSDGLLVWIPILKSFATFDIDHCIGYIFKDTSWLEIEDNLGNIINTQWYPEKSNGILLKPWIEQGFNINFDNYKKND